MKAAELEKYYPLIHKITAKFPKEFKGDLFNTCYIELYNLLEKYDETQGTFQTFAYKRLYYCCVDFINMQSGLVLSLDEYIDSEQGDRFIDLIADENEAHYDYLMEQEAEAKEKQLTPVEILIRRKYREGMTPENIAKVLSPYTHIKSERQVRRILYK